MIQKLFDGREGGVSIGGKKIRNIRFADDMIILAEDIQSLQRFLKALEEGMEEYGMKINLGKTKVMLVNCTDHTNVRINEGILKK